MRPARAPVLTRPADHDDTAPDPDARGRLRLGLVAAAGILVAIPFSLLLWLVVTTWGPLRRLDVAVDDHLNALGYRHGGYVAALRLISDVASPLSFQVAAVVGILLLVRRRQPRLATWLGVTVFGGGVLSSVVKGLVGRKRPIVAHPVAHAVSASFPSGHALGVVVGVGALLLVLLPSARPSHRPWWLGLGAAVVLAVGFARLGLGVHYLSDVLGGYVLGAAWLAATTAAFAAWRDERGHATRPVTEGLEPAAPEPV